MWKGHEDTQYKLEYRKGIGPYAVVLFDTLLGGYKDAQTLQYVTFECVLRGYEDMQSIFYLYSIA